MTLANKEIERAQSTARVEDIRRIVNCEHHYPASVLGPHEISIDGQKAIAIRVYIPSAEEAYVIPSGKSAKPIKMEQSIYEGFFETIIRTRRKKIKYRLQATNHHNDTLDFEDPYRFPPQLSDEEKSMFLKGSYYKLYQKFGAHVAEIDGVTGVNFIVWAPNATRVSVIGNFNGWDGRFHPMNVHEYAGIWELFIPGLSEGEVYKYEIKTAEGALRVKSDPLGFQGELRPSNATIVHRLGQYTWGDTEWLKHRTENAPYNKPIAIYEVHLGSWKTKLEQEKRSITYKNIAPELAAYVKQMGYTHIELMPVSEYPYDGSWGYQVTGYYAPTSRYGTPDDFKCFIDYMHRENIGVIIDWVPAHFPKDDFALRRFDGTAAYEHEDPRQGEHPDWGTLIFNYGRNEVANFLISNALFWFDEYHVDGLRVDAVASMLYLDYSREDGQWVANKYGGRENLEAIDFLKHLNQVIYEHFSNVLMIAEESTAWPGVSRPVHLGGLGFNFKWNMGWMNDFLEYMKQDPIHRKYHHNKITFSLWYAFSENYILVLSHDEVVHGKASLLSKMPGDEWQKFANLRLAYGFMYGHPGKKLLFMGGEFGQWNEWNHTKVLDWGLLEYEPHQKLKRYVSDLNLLYRENPALWEMDFSPKGFQWIDFQDAEKSIVTFLRLGKNKKDFLIFLCNFTPVPRYDYRIGVPADGYYHEKLNSDSEHYGGSNVGNLGGIEAEKIPYQNLDYSIRVNAPPLAVVVFALNRSSHQSSED